MRKTNLQIWTELLRTDLRFMREHGWTKEAYIARYGTAQKPKLGDGGPLIWAADMAGHFHKRERFMQECENHWKKHGKDIRTLPDYARHMLLEMNLIPAEASAFFAKAMETMERQ